MESRVGRAPTGFYTLFRRDSDRMGYLWQRELFRDLPNIPERLRLAIYEPWNSRHWHELFYGLETDEQKAQRLRELLACGEVGLRRLHKGANGLMSALVYDGEKVKIQTASATQIDIEGLLFPRSLIWSNLVVKERITSGVK